MKHPTLRQFGFWHVSSGFSCSTRSLVPSWGQVRAQPSYHLSRVTLNFMTARASSSSENDRTKLSPFLGKRLARLSSNGSLRQGLRGCPGVIPGTFMAGSCGASSTTTPGRCFPQTGGVGALRKLTQATKLVVTSASMCGKRGCIPRFLASG